MTTNEVKIEITGDASKFKRTLKEATSMQRTLGKLPKKLRNQGIQGANKHAARQKKQGKEALKHEKQLQKEMKKTVRAMKEKQKVFKGNKDAIREERRELERLKKAYRETQRFRRGTGTRTMGERLRGGSRALGRGARGGPAAMGKGMGKMAGLAGGGLLAIGGILASAVASLGGFIVNAVSSQIGQGFSQYMNFGRTVAGLAGTGGQRFFRKKSDGTYTMGSELVRSQQLGYSGLETAQQMRGIARQTGGRAGLLDRTILAQSFARSYGGDVGEVGGFMGKMTKAQGRLNSRQFERVMIQAMASGMDKSRAGEAMSAMGQAIGAAGSKSGGAVDVLQIAEFMAGLGRRGGPALQGQRGASFLSQIDAGLSAMGRGGGDANTMRALVYQAYGYGQPGGDTADFLDISQRLQDGMFNDPSMINTLMDRMFSTMDDQSASYVLSSNIGGTMSQWQNLRKAQGTPEQSGLLEQMSREMLPQDRRIAAAVEEGNLQEAQRAAQLDNRLVAIGKSSYEQISGLQDLLNDVVDTILPLALQALTKAVQYLEAIWQGIQELGGYIMEAVHQFTGVDKAEDLMAADRERNKINAQLLRGEITQAEANTRMARVRNIYEEIGSGDPTALERLAGLSRNVLGHDFGIEGGTGQTMRAQAREGRRVTGITTGQYSLNAAFGNYSDTEQRQIGSLVTRTSGRVTNEGISGTLKELAQIIIKREYEDRGQTLTPEEMAAIAAEVAISVGSRGQPDMLEMSDVAAFRAAISARAERTSVTPRATGGD